MLFVHLILKDFLGRILMLSNKGYEPFKDILISVQDKVKHFFLNSKLIPVFLLKINVLSRLVIIIVRPKEVIHSLLSFLVRENSEVFDPLDKL